MALKTRKRMTVVLWLLQALLAALFLFAGAMKLMLPVEAMTKQMPLPGGFLRFIGVAEVLGALGLILPGLFRMLPVLTTFAASGLVLIMIGASVLTAMIGGLLPALFPMTVGFLLISIVYGRQQNYRVSTSA